MRNALEHPVGVRVRDALPDAQAFGGGDVYATSCTCDARRTRPGDVFFALDEDAARASAAARLAAERGAAAIVVDQLAPVFGTPQFLTADARAAFGAFCQQLVGKPSGQLRLTGVVGAHGKSSVARLLASALGCADQPVGCLTPDAQTDGVTSEAADAPAAAPRVARWLSECVAGDCRSAVAVLDESALAQRAFAGAALDTLCLTNMNFDRAGRRSPDAQRRLAAGALSLLSSRGAVVANADDPHAMGVLAQTTCATITFGLEKPADVAGRVLQSHSGGQVLAVTLGYETALIETPIAGAAHASNCLAAIAAAVTQGVDLTRAAHGVEAVTRLPGVMHSLPCGQPFPVYLDRGASPERVRAALAAARPAATGRLIAVLPEGASAAVQSVATSLSDLTIVPAAEPAVEPSPSVRAVDDRFSAVALALALADPGDAVVITGAARSRRERSEEETTVRELLAMRLAQPEESAVAP